LLWVRELRDVTKTTAKGVVTDSERRWVLAVATKSDLEVGRLPGCLLMSIELTYRHSSNAEGRRRPV
jgi:hypothetical protein